jgi:hypothetical protein
MHLCTPNLHNCPTCQWPRSLASSISQDATCTTPPTGSIPRCSSTDQDAESFNPHSSHTAGRTRVLPPEAVCEPYWDTPDINETRLDTLRAPLGASSSQAHQAGFQTLSLSESPIHMPGLTGTPTRQAADKRCTTCKHVTNTAPADHCMQITPSGMRNGVRSSHSLWPSCTDRVILHGCAPA